MGWWQCHTMDASEQIYQLKVRLLGISPMIWRRVLVPTSTTLRELHGIVQVAMGWEGIHLFLFDVYAVRYGSFELHAADPDVPLQLFDFRKNERERFFTVAVAFDNRDGLLRVDLSRQKFRLRSETPWK